MVTAAAVKVQKVNGNLYHVGAEAVVLTTTGKALCTCQAGRHNGTCEHGRAVKAAWLAQLVGRAA